MSLYINARILSISILLLVCGLPTRGADVVESWKTLEEELVEEINDKTSSLDGFSPLSWDDLRTLSTTKRIEKEGRGFWLSCMHNGEFTTQLVGYHCIAEHSPEFTTDAALLFLLLKEQTPSVFRLTGAGKHLRTLSASPYNLKAFTIAMRRPFERENRRFIDFAVSEFPDAFLEEWVRQIDEAFVPPANEAIVVNRLLSRTTQRPDDVAQILAERLKKYERIPGLPRVVNVLHCELKDKSVLRSLQSILVDDSLTDSEFQMAFFTHKELVRDAAAAFVETSDETGVRRIAWLKARILQ